MTIVEALRENRRKLHELSAKHQEIGVKFNAFVAPLRKQCDDKLRREKFGSFVAIEKAHEKAQRAQANVIAQMRVLEKASDDLLQAPDAEVAPLPDDLPAEQPQADELPEFDL